MVRGAENVSGEFYSKCDMCGGTGISRVHGDRQCPICKGEKYLPAGINKAQVDRWIKAWNQQVPFASFRTRHSCKMIARLSPLSPGREVWIGELLQPDFMHPVETHCIHIKTPENDVVFGVYAGDAGFLAVMAQILHGGPINPEWVSTMEEYMRRRAEKMSAQ